MSFFRDRHVIFPTESYPEVREVSGYRHYHPEEGPREHQHLIGGPAWYLDSMWDILTIEGEHLHLTEISEEDRHES